MSVDAVIEDVAFDQILRYPLRRKDDLVDAMAQRSTIIFRGATYDAARNADLLPSFFFPIAGPDDFLAKVGELLVARALAPWPSDRASASPAPRVPSEAPSTHLAEVVARLEMALSSPTRDGFVPADRVDALDIVMHGLEFRPHPDGLELWREALWQQRLHAEARTAVEAMGDYVTAAAQRGEWAAISTICDCLDELLEPALLATRHVGGTATTTPEAPTSS